MSRILGHFKDAVNAFTDSEAPLNEDGATPRPSYLSRKITDIQERVIRGPGFTLNDLVSPCRILDTGMRCSAVGVHIRLRLRV